MTRTRNRRGFATACVVGSALGLVTGCAGGSGSTSVPSSSTASVKATRFKVAARECKADAFIEDSGKSLIMDGAGITGDTAGKASVTQQACILKTLGASSAVVAHIDSTRALDWQQTDEWDGIKARWTYHPDSGLDIVLTDSR